MPGFQDPTYFLYPSYIYPAHQKLADGRVLKDVPAKEWATLPEIAEKPLSYGPFVVSDWKKGESMTFVAQRVLQAGAGAEEGRHPVLPRQPDRGGGAAGRRCGLPGEGDPGRGR